MAMSVLMSKSLYRIRTMPRLLLVKRERGPERNEAIPSWLESEVPYPLFIPDV